MNKDLELIYNCINNIQVLKGKSMFITGATGWFGIWVLKFLSFLNESYNFNIKITILTRNYNKFINKFPEFKQEYIKYIENDICNFNIKKEYFNYILDMVDAETNDFTETYKNMIGGLNNLINNISNINNNIEKMLFVSSGSIYGVQPEYLNNINEKYNGNPITAYAIAKKESEKILLNSNINVSIARGFTFIGEYIKFGHFAISNFIDDVINNRDIIIKGDGRPMRTYLYMADAIYWLLEILLNSKDKSIYNVGASEPISILELAQKVASSVPNYNGDIKVLTKINENDKIHRYIPDNTKIKKELKVKENFTIDEAISKTIGFYLNKKDIL